MFRYFVWSEGFGRGGVQPWLSVANASPEVMRVEIRLGMEDGRAQTETYTVAPLQRRAWPLADLVAGQHFWLRVSIDQIGAATLVVWDKQYTLPPYTPPPSIYDSASVLALTAQPPQTK